MNRWAALALTFSLIVLLGGMTAGQELERFSDEPIGWWVLNNASAETISEALDAHAARLIDLEVTSVSPLRFSACLVENDGAYASAWWWYFGLSVDRVAELLDELQARIIDLEIYDVDGQLRFAVILVPNTGAQARAWWWYFGVTASTLSDLIAQNDARLVDLELMTRPGEQLYAAVMVHDPESSDGSWSWHASVSPDDLSALFASGPVRILDLERTSNGRFAAILARPSQESWNWWWWFGLGSSDLTDVANLTGGRIVDIEHYTQGGASRYAAVQTGARADETSPAERTAHEMYPIEIVLTTTSDWTLVRFLDAEIVVHEQEILTGADAEGLDTEAGTELFVAQICCDTASVQIRFRADLYLSDPSDSFRLQIEKGHIGQTEIALHAPGDPDPIATYSHSGVVDDPGNTRTFTIYAPYVTSSLTYVLASPLE